MPSVKIAVSRRGAPAAARRPPRRVSRAAGGGGAVAVMSFVVQCVEHVQPRSSARRDDRRAEAGEDGDHREADQLGDRDRQPDVVLRQRLRDQRREKHAEWESERGADQRGDDALVADHPARLPAGHPDRAQHAELARPLEHREYECVDHPEEAHHDREGEEHVEEPQEAREALRVVRRVRGAGMELGVAEAGRGRDERLVRARRRVEERELVLRLGEHFVECLLADRDRAEHLFDLRWVVDSTDDDRPLVARRGLDGEPLADRRVLVVGVGLGDECAVRPESGDRRGGGALDPLERVEAPDRCRLDPGDVLLLARHERLVDADVRGRLQSRYVRHRVALRGCERNAVRTVDDVRRLDLVSDGRLDRLAQAGAEHRHDGDEREPDHQRRRGRRGPARIAHGVRAGEVTGDPTAAARRRADQPSERLHRCGAASATPRNKARMPMPSRAATAIVLSPLANTPTEMAATEPPTTTTAAFSECAAKREGGRIDPSRTAAIGGTRVARRAGRMLATSVMSVPSASEMMMVLGANTRPASGRSEPTSAFIALAMPTPAKSPTTEARRPITSPSSTTERITYLREPPSVRSVANSRVRWATVIDSVLKITNAPTNRAMQPKPSRK